MISGPFIGQRHVQAVLLFACIAVNYMIKYNTSIALVAMTNAATTNPDFPEYDWNEMEKSYILSSIFWGYVVTQFIAGHACRRFGAKMVLLVSTLGSAIAAIVVPFTVSWGGWQIFCFLRVLQGAFQGFDLPCVHVHLAMWSPVEERNRLGALASSGIECGTVMAMFISGLIATSSLGWPGISYVSGAIAIAWCILWQIFAANSPSQSKFISKNECNYIESSINAMKKESEETATTGEQQIPIPWKAILHSPPFWALLIVRVAENWGFSAIQAKLPAYMNGVFGMDMKSNTLYSALPYITLWILSYCYLILADILLKYKIVSLNILRKSFNTVAYWVPTAGLIAVGFLEADQQTLAIILMITSVGLNSGCTIGSGLNPIDLSPNHAGILSSITNAVGSIMPILTPLVNGVVVTDETNRFQWQIVFAITAAVFFVGNLVYIIWGSTDRQVWDNPNYLDAKKDAENSNELNSSQIENGTKL
ncbi:putative inorganic phosphate cotransporter [Musca vetustissima]|uniref:putative inorganic phosphate cotransporter n=1 Tax=Musca vetustissima TaxID=27455 RepID=UPI002AB7183C|nr:putative inorganic phosphate cotransporter [Musca vetustissima]